MAFLSLSTREGDRKDEGSRPRVTRVRSQPYTFGQDARHRGTASLTLHKNLCIEPDALGPAGDSNARDVIVALNVLPVPGAGEPLGDGRCNGPIGRIIIDTHILGDPSERDRLLDPVPPHLKPLVTDRNLACGHGYTVPAGGGGDPGVVLERRQPLGPAVRIDASVRLRFQRDGGGTLRFLCRDFGREDAKKNDKGGYPERAKRLVSEETEHVPHGTTLVVMMRGIQYQRPQYPWSLYRIFTKCL